MAAQVTVKLRGPIERRSKETGQVLERIEELVIRPLKLGDLVAAMDASGGGRDLGTLTLHLAARACGVPAGDLAELGMEDGQEVLDAVTGFMPAGLKAGTKG